MLPVLRRVRQVNWSADCLGQTMKYVYLIESASRPGKRYVGATLDLRKRMGEHNAGQSPYTRAFAPWQPVVVVRFADERKADAFERYLKSGSGHAFAKRHFW